MAPGRAESDFGLQGWIDTLGLKQIFSIFSVKAEVALQMVISKIEWFKKGSNFHQFGATTDKGSSEREFKAEATDFCTGGFCSKGNIRWRTEKSILE